MTRKKPNYGQIEKKRCKYCGKYFEPHRPTVKYCSENCMEKFYSEFYQEKRALLKKRKPVEIIKCAMCGKDFERKSPSHLFCSEECTRARRIERYHERRKTGGVIYPKSAALREKKSDYIECNRCGKIFRSWDRTKNRRCSQCQSEIENTYSGADIFILETIR